MTDQIRREGNASPQSDRSSDLAREVARLRGMVVAALLLAAVAVIANIFGWPATRTVRRMRAVEIEARSFVLRDDQGQVRARFEVLNRSMARLIFTRQRADGSYDPAVLTTAPLLGVGIAGSGLPAVGLEQMGDRGHAFVREGDKASILGGHSLEMSRGYSVPDVILGDWEDGFTGLVVGGHDSDPKHWRYFPARVMSSTDAGGRK